MDLPEDEAELVEILVHSKHFSKTAEFLGSSFRSIVQIFVLCASIFLVFRIRKIRLRDGGSCAGSDYKAQLSPFFILSAKIILDQLL